MKLVPLVALALVLLIGEASAGTLTTLPVFVGTDPSGQLVRCRILNVGPSDRNVTIQIVNASGQALVTTPFEPLPGGESGTEALAGAGVRYCRFIFSGPKTQFRAGATVGTVGSEFYMVPAQ